MARKSDYQTDQIIDFVKAFVKAKRPRSTIKVVDILTFCNDELEIYPKLTRRKIYYNKEVMEYINKLNSRIQNRIFSQADEPIVLPEQFVTFEELKKACNSSKTMENFVAKVNEVFSEYTEIQVKLSQRISKQNEVIDNLTNQNQIIEQSYKNLRTSADNSQKQYKKELRDKEREIRLLKSEKRKIIDYLDKHVTEATILGHLCDLGVLDVEESETTPPLFDIPLGEENFEGKNEETEVISAEASKWLAKFEGI